MITDSPPDIDLNSAFFVGEVEIPSRIALAPMAGVSVQAFRRQGRRFGAGLVCSEMVSACGLHYSNERTQGYLRVASDETPIAVQLFGTDPALMAEAAQMVEQSGADLIDINMGCPVKKVTKTSAGCKMLDDPDLAVAVAKAVTDAVSIPLMVKMRRGMADGSRRCMELGPRLVEEAGVKALTLHPRSAHQMYTGFADHALTKELVELVDVPVFASGDIKTHNDAKRVIAQTGAAAVMIGRAAQGNPWTLRQIASGELVAPTPDERVAELIWFMRDTQAEMEHRATGFLRKFYAWYLRGEGFPKTLRNELVRLDTPEDVEAKLLGMYPGARQHLAALEAKFAVDATDRLLELPISIYGGG